MGPGGHQPPAEQKNSEERVASLKRLQFVPNWKGMIIPETTPIPNETANILVQNPDMRNQI